jgi:hypothetical protein
MVCTRNSLPLDHFLGRVSQERNHLSKVDVCIVFAVLASRPPEQADAFQ